MESLLSVFDVHIKGALGCLCGMKDALLERDLESFEVYRFDYNLYESAYNSIKRELFPAYFERAYQFFEGKAKSVFSKVF